MKKILSVFLVAILFAASFTVNVGAKNRNDGIAVFTVQNGFDKPTASEGDFVNVQPSDALEEQNNDANNENNQMKPIESTAFEKVFQVFFIVIMSIGVLGLPLYFWLNSKKKKALEEYYENIDREDENGDQQ